MCFSVQGLNSRTELYPQKWDAYIPDVSFPRFRARFAPYCLYVVCILSVYCLYYDCTYLVQS